MREYDTLFLTKIDALFEKAGKNNISRDALNLCGNTLCGTSSVQVEHFFVNADCNHLPLLQK
jgi:hypothetical protein